MTQHSRAFSAPIEAIEARVFMSVSHPISNDDPPIVAPPAALNTLLITQAPTQAQLGQTLSPITVEIFDPAGNLATADDSQITLSGGSLSGTTTVTAQQGIAVFSNVQINQPGTESLTASGTNDTSVTTQPITVSSTVVAGQRFAPVKIDPASLFSKADKNARWIKIKLVNSVDGKIALTKTFYPKRGQPFVAGNLSSLVAGDFNVTAFNSLGHSAIIQQVTVSPAAPHQLWFINQPRVLDINSTVTVEVLDQYGNPTTAADGSEVVLHAWLPKGLSLPGLTLSGETTATVENGIATFAGLTMNQAGQAHLIARLGNLKPVVSNVFQPGATLDISPGNNGPF